MKRISRTFMAIISLVLVVSMVCSNMVFATDTQEENADFSYRGHGEYILANYESREAESERSIYSIGNGKYLIQADDGKYLSAEKLVVNYENPEKWFEDHSEHNLPEDLVNDVINRINSYNGSFPDNFCVEIYSPTKTDDTFEESNRGGETPGLEPGSGDSDAYYNYGGYYMKIHVVVYGETVSTINYLGTNPSSALNAISYALLTVAGLPNHVTGIFTAAITAADYYRNHFGPAIPSTLDYLQTSIGFYDYEKYTSIYVTSSGLWNMCQHSHKVHTNNYVIVYHDATNGMVHSDGDHTCSHTKYSAHYQAPSDAAIANFESGWGGMADASIYFNVGGSTAKMSD